MSDPIREMLIAACSAARYGTPLESAIAQAIASGDRSLTIDQLKFDSLAWMEFCIFVELQSGQELTPVDIEGMHYVFEIADWLNARSLRCSTV